MAGSSLLTLLDDIASVLDDVAVLSKVAAKKTAGVLGDDLALNAQQVSGVRADRELPVVWAVARGSLLNKVILVPVALLLSYFLPQAITPLLVLGGLFLCFEGVEKVVHSLTSSKHSKEHQQEVKALSDPNFDLVAFERKKIKGAIRTDFILSAEIIVIALGSFGEASFTTTAIALSVIALCMTIGVYGLVALIVKLDDMGLALVQKHQPDGHPLAVKFGQGLLAFAPMLMKFLSVAGTIAMFLVGGGILVHAFPVLHHWLPDMSGVLQVLADVGINLVIGAISGAIVLAGVSLVKRALGK